MTASILAVLAVPSPVEASWSRALPKAAYEALGRCETGGERGNTRHSTRSYVGAFGWARSTFDLFADTPASRAHTLTWEQQVRVLDRTFFFGYTRPDGTRQFAVGPWGHGCFKRLEWVQALVCRAGKHSIRRWCR